MEIKSSPGQGTSIIMYLPASDNLEDLE
jgi:hypothetical protein